MLRPDWLSYYLAAIDFKGLQGLLTQSPFGLEELLLNRHLTYYIDSVKPLISAWEFLQEHDILTSSLLHVNNQDLIHTLHTCTADSIKVALGIGN